MPALFPIIVIFAVVMFISTHASASSTKQQKQDQPKSPSADLAKAIEEVIKASKG